MRLVTYRTSSHAPWQAGIEQDGYVLAASAAYAYSDQLPTVRALLEAGPEQVARVLEDARKIFGGGREQLLALDELELGPPIPDPDKIICLGLNYADHAAESKMALPAAPILFAKFRNSLIGPYDNIVLPRVSKEVDYEAELAVVIGRPCKDVLEEDALNYVAGYTIMNDVSARDLQFLTNQWTAGKAIDTFAPMGPGIIPASEIPNPQALMVSARVNGQTLQHASTELMIFSVAHTIAFISSFLTLVPGDIISTGTPAGIGSMRKPPIYLHDGDVVEIEIERIGTITNKVVGPTVS